MPRAEALGALTSLRRRADVAHRTLVDNDVLARDALDRPRGRRRGGHEQRQAQERQAAKGGAQQWTHALGIDA